MKLISVLILYRSVCICISRRKKKEKKRKLEKKKKKKKREKKIKTTSMPTPPTPPPPRPRFIHDIQNTLRFAKPRTYVNDTPFAVFFVCCTFQYPDLSLEGAATRCPADLCVAHPIIKAVRSTVEVAIKFHLLPPNFVIPIVHNCSHELFIRGGRDDERAPPLRGLNNNELRISIRIFSMKNDEKDTYIYIYEILYICISIQ